MGLDSLEILIEVEKTFGINIPDQEAEQISTVQDFHNTVWLHLSGKHSDKCHSQSLFYKLRKSFTESYNFSKRDFVPDLSLNDIFPNENRRLKYLQFSNSTNLKLPDLVLGKPWSTILISFGFITIIGGLVLALILINFFSVTKWTLIFPVVGTLLTAGLSNLLDSKRILIEPNTIRDFTTKTLSLNFAEILKTEGSSRKEMELVINNIIADKSGFELTEITPEKKICDDLGID